MLQSFHIIGTMTGYVVDWLRPGTRTVRKWARHLADKEVHVNKPFGVIVSDRIGNWDLWLVGAKDREEAVSFVSAYWLIRGRKVTAYDLSVPEEAVNVCVFGVPKVCQHDYPHFLPVPASSGCNDVLRRPGMYPLVSSLASIDILKPSKKQRKQRVQKMKSAVSTAPVESSTEAPVKRKRGRPSKKELEARRLQELANKTDEQDKPGLIITSLEHRVDTESYRK